MSELVESAELQHLLDRIGGLDAQGGDARTKAIVRRIVGDLFATIDDFDISAAEFWRALHFVQQAAPEFGLIAPGLGFDRFLDIRADRAEGDHAGTPRTIEGPLYVPGAPLSAGHARLDDVQDAGETLVMHGRVVDKAGGPIAGAVVDVWHANRAGAYSTFDPSQPPYNNRRRIETDAQGRYAFRSILPSGYAVPSGGSTERLLAAIGRHGRRPAHIHFFVSAPGHRHLTTQINIDGDPDLHDDFAYATREGLIPAVTRRTGASVEGLGVDGPHAEIAFDFVLVRSDDPRAHALPDRPRVPAHA